jgi:threonine dehydratase
MSLLPTQLSVEIAAERIRGIALRTPLLRLNVDSDRAIYLKPENLQPIGSFKVRCGANALLSRTPAERNGGVTTASAGNFAQGLAYAGRRVGIAVRAVVPETAARSKLAALEQLGAETIVRPYRQWWELLEQSPTNYEGRPFIHPVSDPEVLAGNATIGREILEDLPEVETVIVPFGGGGLAVGIAAALKARRPSVRVLACETEAGQPLAAAFAAGGPREVPFNSNTFVTGMGSPRVLDAMWPLIRQMLDGTMHVSLRETADAVRLLLSRHHLIAEGAGAAPVAAAQKALPGSGPIVCIVSGGHLDSAHLRIILEGNTP